MSERSRQLVSAAQQRAADAETEMQNMRVEHEKRQQRFSHVQVWLVPQCKEGEGGGRRGLASATTAHWQAAGSEMGNRERWINVSGGVEDSILGKTP